MARIRSSARGKTDAVAAVAREIDFRHLWRQLRAAGWTAKRPSGLQTEWTYTNPGGVIVFVGEDAVVTHCVESGLLVDDGSSKEDTSSAAEFQGASQPVRASQIDTSVQLSQGTIDTIFSAPSQSEVELSPAAVTTAFDLSQRDLQFDMAPREANHSLPPLSGVSEAEKGGGVASHPADIASLPPRAQRQPGHAVQGRLQHDGRGDQGQSVSTVGGHAAEETDVNYIPEGENTSVYESLSSGESDGVAYEEDDDDPKPDEYDDNEDILSDSDAVEMDEAFIASLQLDGGTDRLTVKQREAALRAMDWSPVSTAFEANATPYPGLSTEEAQPVSELRALCHSPLLTFFYFMPKSLWVQINEETNLYGLQQVDRRARAIQEKQARQSERCPDTLKNIRRRLRSKHEYQTHEILHVIGLLIARMLCPQKRFSAHWSMVEDGAVPAGSFGRFMGRNRCQDILRDLHFVNNEEENTRDKLWKLRPVVNKIQQRFQEGWSLPAVFSFDEGVLPSTSKRNTTRMFMPDKPHRYGSKIFMTCDSRTAYCHRFEMYLGKRNKDGASNSAIDNKTGAAAVVRNLKAVLGSTDSSQWRAVVVDRYYSSILLAIELLKMNVYVIGTIMTNRLGLDKRIKVKSETRPASIPRGSFTFSRSVAIPTMVAFHWWDRKPVHYLCTGAVMTPSTIGRKVKQVGAISVPCPAAVNDYQRWMGGVDVHDQLRLQSFSLQTSTRFKKPYRSIFLGFVDLVLVNSYISHKESAKISGTMAMTRRQWYGVLQNQLLQLKAHDFADVVPTPPPTLQKRKRTPVRLTHVPEQSEDWVTVSNVQKRRQRSCKVCALLRTDSKKKSFATTYFCERCSIDDAKCWLCNKIRREYRGVAKTCFEIWHDDFGAGQAIPPNLGKRVVLRRPGKDAGERKKTRRELRLGAGGDEADDESD